MTRLYRKQDPESIQSMFNSIAKDYDRANTIISFSLHRLWNRQLIQTALKNLNGGPYLDLCSGTGEIAFGILKQLEHPCKAFLLDFSEQMLLQAEIKAPNLSLHHHSIDYLCADAENIPLPDESVNIATIAYGIRNINHPENCLKDTLRALRPGGTLAILELTEPENALFRGGHKLYTSLLLPLLGKIVASNEEAYQYLCRSIRAFTKPKILEKQLKDVGFVKTNVRPLHGGIATLITGKK